MTPGKSSGFSPELFQFLRDLTRHNERAWFEKNKDRYEEHVREPSLAFVRSFQAPLKSISPYFVANDRRMGGSLMRIHRDTRFSKDKSPYKTNVGIHFRHEMGKDVHCPGYYVHLAPDESFLGIGIWHPDAASLARIREALVEDGTRWKRARDAKAFQARFTLAGDVLKKVPRGFDKQHPLVEDLKRKDFIGVHPLREADVLSPRFVAEVSSAFAAGKSFMRFLCDALRVPF